ncbi:MAG: GNAT family N-acetyltransferase [Proteobacteria bacterium]|nr:GNAT family N-acetyltransferase [Pseudomonadota bacterium]
MKLLENIPLDTQAIAELIIDQGDLNLVWPLADYPFDHNHWQKVLDPHQGNKSFFVHVGNHRIGHAALRTTDAVQVYAISFLYLLPEARSRGLGQKIIHLLERYARKNLAARKLILAVQTCNQGAIKCYLKCGFKEYGRKKTSIIMFKLL